MGLDASSQAQLQQRLDQLMQQQRDLVASLERGQSHFKQLARSVWRVQEEERRRLARELHDGIGQNLTAIVRMLDHAGSAADCGEVLRAELERVRALVHATLAETRALSRQLRPQILDDLGLVAALRWLTRSFADSCRLEMKLEIAESLPVLGGDAETMIFRVAQEALNNIAKHAHATHVEVVLGAAAGRAQLRVHDDGRGCDVGVALASGSEGQGSGLGGMRDRVALFGGTLQVSSESARGFTLQIEFPFASNAAKLDTLGTP